MINMKNPSTHTSFIKAPPLSNPNTRRKIVNPMNSRLGQNKNQKNGSVGVSSVFHGVKKPGGIMGAMV